MKTCDDFYTAKIGCCDSCHEDANLGYGELIEVMAGNEIFARVCCRHHEAARKLLEATPTPSPE